MPRSVWLAVPLGLVLFAVVGLRSESARACSLEARWPLVLPALDTKAPLDTHVWLLRTAPLVEEVRDDKGVVVGKTDRALELRVAALPNKPTTRVEAATKLVGTAAVPMVELIPAADLAPQTLYEVWLVDRSPLSKSYMAGAFRTGTTRDAAPPVWAGVTEAKADDSAWPRKMPLLGGCGGGLTANLWGPPATDDGPVVYGMWFAPVGSAIDYTAAPSALVRAEPRDPSDPKPPLFVVGELGYYPVDVPLPKGEGVHVGIVAIDLAGKRSAPKDVTIDLRPPQARGKPLRKR